jgi:glutamate-5-semialdehyde dehydrogenase
MSGDSESPSWHLKPSIKKPKSYLHTVNRIDNLNQRKIKMAIESTIEEMATAATEAAKRLVRVSTDQKNGALLAIATGLEKEAAFIKAENQKDLARAKEMGLTSAMLDRLAIKDATITAMVEGLKDVVGLNDPIASMGP